MNRTEAQRKYDEAIDLIDPHILYEDRLTTSLTEEDRAAVKKGICILDEIILAEQANCWVWWFRGKAFQTLTLWELEYESFKKSYELLKEKPSFSGEDEGKDYGMVLRELAWAAARLDKLDEAIYYLSLATEFMDDPTVYSNYALILMLKGNYDEAVNMAQKCLEKAPCDTATSVANLIKAVRNGELPKPTSYLDLRDIDPADYLE